MPSVAKTNRYEPTPRFYGWRRQPDDSRDIVYAVPRALVRGLPKAVDLSSNMGPLLDQEDLGSCGPTSVCEMISFDQKIQRQSQNPASRLFIYYTTRVLLGTTIEDSGVDNRTMLKALNRQGYCAERLLPYNTARFTAKPTAAMYKAALPFAVKNYAVVHQSLDQMKGCLAAGRPFLFGFSCFPGLESAATAKTGIVPDPRVSESTIGGHDVTICGYDDTTRRFKFRNHWRNADGRPWGDKGYGYISYTYASNPRLAGDFWVINAVANVL